MILDKINGKLVKTTKLNAKIFMVESLCDMFYEFIRKLNYKIFLLYVTVKARKSLMSRLPS